MVTQYKLLTCEGKQELYQKVNFKSATTGDLNKSPILFHVCATCSELPANISTMSQPHSRSINTAYQPFQDRFHE